MSGKKVKERKQKKPNAQTRQRQTNQLRDLDVLQESQSECLTLVENANQPGIQALGTFEGQPKTFG